MGLSIEFEQRLSSVRPKVRFVSITGTNGKTTTTAMIDAILLVDGQQSARIDSQGGWINGKHLETNCRIDVVEEAAQIGVRTIALEAGSVELAGGLACSFPPTIGILTNFSSYFLTYHGTFDEARAATAQLFVHLLPGGTAVFNAADPVSGEMERLTPKNVNRVAYTAKGSDGGCKRIALALEASKIVTDRNGTTVRLQTSELSKKLGGELRLKTVGIQYGENALAAAVAADALGVKTDAIRNGLEHFAGVRGRFEIVAHNPTIVVDYAYTPQGLETALNSARALAKGQGKLFCVFGCGGYPSDRGIRSSMGQVARRIADVVILTSDNPRYDNPETIADDIEDGIGSVAADVWFRELDREKAILQSCKMATAHDVVLIAGKGSETSQNIRGQQFPFSDAQVAREAIDKIRTSRQS